MNEELVMGSAQFLARWSAVETPQALQTNGWCMKKEYLIEGHVFLL